MKSVTLKNITPASIGYPYAGEQNQFASGRGVRYGPLKINKWGIFVNNGTLDSTVVNSSGFLGYNNAGLQLITIDASTGLNIVDDTGDNSLSAIIQGTDIGDVVMGDYTGGAGAWWDKSTATFTVKGNLTAGSISIGTSPSWFKVDSTGNMWLGGATFGAATFSVSNAGAVTATSGEIGGWTLGASTLTGGDAILDSDGTITVSNGDDKVVMTTATGVGYLDFYAGGTLKARMRGNTAVSGGAQLTQGDFGIANNYSYLMKGTGATYARIGNDGSNNVLFVLGSADTFYLKNQAEDTNLFTVSSTQVYCRKKLVIQDDEYIEMPKSTTDRTDAEGNFYYNSSAHELKFYNGTAWKTISYT